MKGEAPAETAGERASQAVAEFEPIAESSVRDLASSARSTLAGWAPADLIEGAFRDPADLDRLAERLGCQSLLEDPRLLGALAIVLAVQLARELELEWVEECQSGELGLRRPESTVVFYPRRMAHSQTLAARAEGRAAPRLGWLLRSTRDYLKSLLRFFPTAHRRAVFQEGTDRLLD